MNYHSNLIEDAINALSGFPGIGKRSALRMVLYLLKRPIEETEKLSDSLIQLKKNLKQCKTCYNISEKEICMICENPQRDRKTICLVEDFQDIIAIENTAQYKGIYHVLGGLISPIDGIGPDALNIEPLIKRLQEEKFEEIIIALNSTIEGDTTTFYLARKINPYEIKISTLSKGLSVGTELEYADEITLGRSITYRIPYQL